MKWEESLQNVLLSMSFKIHSSETWGVKSWPVCLKTVCTCVCCVVWASDGRADTTHLWLDWTIRLCWLCTAARQSSNQSLDITETYIKDTAGTRRGFSDVMPGYKNQSHKAGFCMISVSPGDRRLRATLEQQLHGLFKQTVKQLHNLCFRDV